MAILNYATDIGDIPGKFVDEGVGGGFETITNSSRLGPGVSRGIGIRGGVSSPITVDFTDQSEVWISGYEFCGVTGDAVPIITIFDAGTAKWRLIKTGNGTSTAKVQAWNGSSWDDLGSASTATFGNNTLVRLDIRLNISNTGNFQVYIDGTLDIDYSGDTLRDVSTTCDSARFENRCDSSSDLQVWSAIFIATTDTTQLEAIQLNPNAAGASSAWTGSFSNINDLGFPIDASIIHTDTDNLVSQFGTTNVPALYSGRTVEAVAVKARATVAASINGELELGVRSGTTDGWGSVETLDNFWTPYVAVFANNPDTVAAWTTAEIDAMQVGVRSGVV